MMFRILGLNNNTVRTCVATNKILVVRVAEPKDSENEYSAASLFFVQRNSNAC